MKKLGLLIMLLLFLQICIADTELGTIQLFIQNRPPTITSMSLLPEEPYYDSELECRVEIDDENPESVKIYFKWYSDGLELDENTKFLSGFTDDDNIMCVALATDDEGLKSNTEKVETKILLSPVRVKVLKPVLNAVGIRVSAKELKESTSMASVTGMVVGNGEGPDTLPLLISLFLIIILALNAFGLMVYWVQKRKSRS